MLRDNIVMQSVFKKLGFRLRLFDYPELMDRNGESSWFHADESITYLQLKARTEALSPGIEKARFSAYGIEAYATLFLRFNDYCYFLQPPMSSC